MQLQADRFFRQVELLEELALQVAGDLEHFVLLAGELDALLGEHYDEILVQVDRLQQADQYVGVLQFVMEDVLITLDWPLVKQRHSGHSLVGKNALLPLRW